MVARHERQLPNERAIIDRPYGFVRCRFVTSNPPINQNLTEKRGEIAEGRRGGGRRGCAKTRENRGALVIHRIFGGFLAILGKRCRRKPEKTIFHESFPQFPQSFPQDAVGFFVGNGSYSFLHIFVRSLGFSLRLAATRALARKRAVENGEWKIDVYRGVCKTKLMVCRGDHWSPAMNDNYPTNGRSLIAPTGLCVAVSSHRTHRSIKI